MKWAMVDLHTRLRTAFASPHACRLLLQVRLALAAGRATLGLKVMGSYRTYVNVNSHVLHNHFKAVLLQAAGFGPARCSDHGHTELNSI